MDSANASLRAPHVLVKLEKLSAFVGMSLLQHVVIYALRVTLFVCMSPVLFHPFRDCPPTGNQKGSVITGLTSASGYSKSSTFGG